MRKLFSMFAVCAALSLAGAAYAAKEAAKADKPVAEKPAAEEVTLKGTATCAKCALKQTEKCQNALKVKDGEKDVWYLIADNAVSKKYHGKVCKGEAEATVKGTVAEVDGKRVITASSIE